MFINFIFMWIMWFKCNVTYSHWWCWCLGSVCGREILNWGGVVLYVGVVAYMIIVLSRL